MSSKFFYVDDFPAALFLYMRSEKIFLKLYSPENERSARRRTASAYRDVKIHRIAVYVHAIAQIGRAVIIIGHAAGFFYKL